MKEIKLTCPFTGCDFTATQTADGDLFIIHPLTNEQIKISYNASIKKYNIDANHFKHIETVTSAQAEKILDVTKQRVYQIVKNETIPVHYTKPYGEVVFILDDVLSYKNTRKVGKPKKNEK